MFKRIWAIAAIALLGTLAVPAHAQRSLDVPSGSGWKHSETGLILRATIAGLQRTGLTDNGNDELDVMGQFSSADQQTFATVYLYRPALMSVPMWFDRSETQILLNQKFGRASPAGAALAFAPPRGTAASGLRRVYQPSKGPYASTGLVMMPLGKWLVAVRLTSETMDPAALDAKLVEIVGALGWPQGVADAPAAMPVAACATSLPYARRARMRKPDVADGLLGGAMSALGNSEAGMPADPVTFCRDLPPKAEFAVYRDPASTSSYVMAMGDAGIVIRIIPELDNKGGSMVFVGFLDHNSIYPPFEKLPHPDDVMGALSTSRPLAQASLDGKNITLSMPPN